MPSTTTNTEIELEQVGPATAGPTARVFLTAILAAALLAASGCNDDDEAKSDGKRSQVDQQLTEDLEQIKAERRKRAKRNAANKKKGKSQSSTGGGSTGGQNSDIDSDLSPTGWCASSEGRPLRDLERPVKKAYSDGDTEELRDLTDDALDEAEGAPRGEPCAVLLLGRLALYWNSGDLKKKDDIDAQAQAQRVLDFAREQKLDKIAY